MSYTYTNSINLPVSNLELSGALGATEVLVIQYNIYKKIFQLLQKSNRRTWAVNNFTYNRKRQEKTGEDRKTNYQIK